MNAENQISLSDLGIWCGKTSSELSVQTTAKTSEQSLKKPPELSTEVPLFLDLRTGAPGLILGVFWQTDGLSLGAYTMRSFGALPKNAAECRLSQILEDRPHPKHYLSVATSRGLLRRMERNEKCPPDVKIPLLKQANQL